MTKKKVAKKTVEKRWRGKVTAALRDKVAIRVVAGVRHDDIARQIGCDQETLVLHFKNELENGREYLRQRVVQSIRKSSREGNVPAMILLHKVTSGQPIDGRGRWKRPNSPIKPVLGKKAQRQIEAEAISQSSSKYAPPSQPKLIVDNTPPRKPVK